MVGRDNYYACVRVDPGNPVSCVSHAWGRVLAERFFQNILGRNFRDLLFRQLFVGGTCNNEYILGIKDLICSFKGLTEEAFPDI